MRITAQTRMNGTPSVRQYAILSNRWGDLLCHEEYATNVTRQNSSKKHAK